jgi:hypothetical protein
MNDVSLLLENEEAGGGSWGGYIALGIFIWLNLD